ncbi:flavodoxin [Mycolicibacterium xanthum]|uniref:flavodoxin n=1 Tax=Mycolicibacterium xanthum TaxID=2796469 RepID=UPI0027DF30AD|nr:flavodoxin [Mycolicibacterium xanthum]
MLLAYFSRAGENYHYGGRIDLEIGNTQVLADMIASEVAVDVYPIEAAEPYPRDYEATVERNKREQDTEARPAIAGALPAVEQYDTVLLGSPIWNVRTPMVMRTFVEGVDLRGKMIHPFVTYAVSGIGATVEDYTRLCPGATIGDSLAIRGEEVNAGAADVTAWLQRARISA